jgi:hypothetical protein
MRYLRILLLLLAVTIGTQARIFIPVVGIVTTTTGTRRTTG